MNFIGIAVKPLPAGAWRIRRGWRAIASGKPPSEIGRTSWTELHLPQEKTSNPPHENSSRTS
jgi:hypothetical protein